jgi:hypothetical protein
MNCLILDTNLLILLTVGAYKPAMIDKHKRTTKVFSIEDFELLKMILGQYQKMVFLPSILVETSNLLSQIGDPDKTAILKVFAELIKRYDEVYLESQLAVQAGHFLTLGLTDSLILETLNGDFELLTVDHKLHIQAVSTGLNAVNFNHLRQDFLY